jgi:hypothetical protein
LGGTKVWKGTNWSIICYNKWRCHVQTLSCIMRVTFTLARIMDTWTIQKTFYRI